MKAFRDVPCRASVRLSARGGFTLIELLIVIGILLLLAATTLAIWNGTADNDRVRSAARQLQSALLGARDRAIFAQRINAEFETPSERGLRLYWVPGSLGVTEMVFVEANAPQEWTTGTPVTPQDAELGELFRRNSNGSSNPTYDAGDEIEYLLEPRAGGAVKLALLRDAGLIQSGATRIRLRRSATSWGEWRQFTFTDVTGGNGGSALGNSAFPGVAREWVRLIPAVDPSELEVLVPTSGTPGTQLAGRNVQVQVELRPSPLATEAPLRLPAGMAISMSVAEDADFDGVLDTGEDLNSNGQLDGQGSWLSRVGLFTPQAAGSPQEFDIMFSPRGAVTGSLASQGLILFLIGAIEDIEQGIDPRWVNPSPIPAIQTKLTATPPKGTWIVLRINPQTGAVTTSPLDLTDQVNNLDGTSGADGFADDIFGFARAGEAANR